MSFGLRSKTPRRAAAARGAGGAHARGAAPPASVVRLRASGA
ncbi:hypothetical protein BURPS305_6047 [Burkholderia pseudomallei 305]|uniref:Uncharacterized protein n=1 Tax=Burkholderia pseudomallei 1710a TaxID=320371 RepID=A0A0E1VQV4_BURPE|nr:hypothetical protein BPC006_II2467 [Burkholderia pseudomallei BPC006]EBA50324.1 hypothetical protein BURPS305_6047 [Burkholderia pseudomallei 305]EDK58096.1 hypothetical protein BMAJHU_E0222 [Burkholderia mallei JHU]EEH28351.1 hypothetical protein BUH_6872 [Burkholderia pseudomallei Pakistan 9]EEP51667.1 hypothetical protein GBP346_B1942 [Burkholderia pseudomallei MSHR346]EEP87856.1 hypothetical protein BMAGB8_A0293 [Burkholderia mallei GB8 horse 4]EET03223.1 hypothetical protein BURPS1710